MTNSYENFDAAISAVEALSVHAEKLLLEDQLHLANTITRAGVVLLSGHVEGFIRDIVEEAVDEISQLDLPPDELPSGLLMSVLKSVVDSASQGQNDRLDRLKHAWRERVGCELDRKKLSSTGGNPTVDVIESIFSVFGVGLVIDRLSIEHFGVDSTFVRESQSSPLMSSVIDVLDGDEVRAAAVLSIIDGKWQPKKRRRSVGYVSALQELLKKRNRIAHGEGLEQVTPQELTLHTADMRKLGRGLDSLIEELLQQLSRANAA